MEAVLGRSARRDCQATRLLQAAFHNGSISLYTGWGLTRESRSPPCAARRSSFRLQGTVFALPACLIWKNAIGFAVGRIFFFAYIGRIQRLFTSMVVCLSP